MILRVFLNFNKITLIVGSLMIMSFFSDIKSNNRCVEFILFGLIYIVYGVFFDKIHHKYEVKNKEKEIILSIVLLWPFVGIISALPLHFSGYFSLSEAIFECISAFTTTGLTMISQDRLFLMPNSIILWRGMLQMIGGLGMIIMIVIFVNKSKNEVYKIFRFSGFHTHYNFINSDSVQTIRKIVFLYGVMGILCFFLYRIFGLKTFDAIYCAMSTLSTGGMNSGTNYFLYGSFGLKITAIAFMVFGALPFIAIYTLISKKKVKFFFEDDQIKYFLLFCCLCCFIGYFYANNINGIFNIVSSITTTGFTIGDISRSSLFGLFLFCGCIGGCTGSTSGGVKFLRILICYRYVKQFISYIIQPNSINIIQINKKKVLDDEIKYITSIIIIFIWVIAWSYLLLSFILEDHIIAMNTVLSMIGNSGIDSSFIEKIKSLTHLKKTLFSLISCTIMIIGRVDYLIFFIVFNRKFWRN